MDIVKTAVSTVGRAAQYTSQAEKLESETQEMLNTYIHLKTNILDEKVLFNYCFIYSCLVDQVTRSCTKCFRARKV